ncbi:putative LuxR-family transcriptional regulator [hydrothermal vent metagenome]|uniref:Putative LuxR-family transcriptional regulator n=1 Tax=hydrothermal vent metagenome TaxID=652676 RepID=A0A1W1D3S8_9ZZZZ
MKKYFLVRDKATQNYLNTLFIKNNYITPKDTIEPSILFVHLQSYKKEIDTIFSHFEHCYIAILSDNPSFEEGYKLLQFHIKAYANTYMAKIHYQQLIMMLENNNTWFYPDFTQKLLDYALTNHKPSQDKLQQLTPKELEVAKLVAKSLKNHEIAQKLGIKERTVKQHLSNIFEKLHIKDRVSLALLMK